MAVISDALMKLVHDFGDAADDVGDAYARPLAEKLERKQASARMVAARAALVAAIEAEVEAARQDDDACEHDWQRHSDIGQTCTKCYVRRLTPYDR